jgi:signal peptidase II
MRFKNRLFWIAALVSVICDRLSKWWILENFELGESQPLWSGIFHFTFVTNKGAAFSLFAEQGEWLRWLSLVVSLGLIALGTWASRLPRSEQAGYGCILGGALGNGIDRFFRGEVVDFLHFQLIQFPIFNLADVFINIGIVFLLLTFFSASGNKKREKKDHQ